MAPSLLELLLAAGRYLWASPVTVLGLVAAAASLSVPRPRSHVLVCRSGSGFARLFLSKRGYCAMALGHVVLMTPLASEETLAHELVHVRQAERWGPLFLPAYLLAMLAARIVGDDPYWDNPFEREARVRSRAT